MPTKLFRGAFWEDLHCVDGISRGADRQVGPSAYALPCTKCQGYRTKRVGFMVTFRLVGAEKSVLKLVGANLKDGQNVLVL